LLKVVEFLRFTAMVIVGDRNGTVGVGYGKAREVPDAIRKALESAKKNLIKLPVSKGTIPHAVIGKAGAAEIIMKPAAPGTGIISGGVTRSLFELAGVHDILAKSVRSRNPNNLILAVFDGFKKIRSLDQVASYRGKEISEIIYRKEG